MLNLLKRFKAAWIGFWHPESIQFKDPLTGALSRNTFIHAFQRELARAERGQSPSLFLAFIDLDGLKKINDNQGHEAGDLYMREFARTVLKHIRPYDILVRWGGGDEFLLLLSGSAVGAEETVKRIYGLFPCFSWGISTWSEGMDLDLLVKQADAKMYKMKKSKK